MRLKVVEGPESVKSVDGIFWLFVVFFIMKYQIIQYGIRLLLPAIKYVLVTTQKSLGLSEPVL